MVQLVTPKAVSAAMAAWIMACRICFQVIFFELFIGIFVLKDLFFSVIPDKDEESVGIKMIAFRFFTLFRITKMRTLHFVDKNDKAALVNDKNDNTNGVLGQNLPHQVSYSRFPFILTF